MSAEGRFSTHRATAHITIKNAGGEDLHHPRGIRTRRNARDVDSACFQVHDREHIARNEPVSRPHFDRREVRGKERVPVSFQNRGPRL